MAHRTDSTVSHGMGKAKSAKTRPEGLVGVFKALAEQHKEVTALLERVRGHADQRAELWPVIRIQLISHERSEVRELYPVLRTYPETRAFADDHDEEARDLAQLIETLDDLDLRSAAWGETFDEMADAVVAHATEEETEIFPVAQQVLGEPRAEQLETTVLLAKQQIAAAV